MAKVSEVLEGRVRYYKNLSEEIGDRIHSMFYDEMARCLEDDVLFYKALETREEEVSAAPQENQTASNYVLRFTDNISGMNRQVGFSSIDEARVFTRNLPFPINDVSLREIHEVLLPFEEWYEGKIPAEEKETCIVCGADTLNNQNPCSSQCEDNLKE